MKPADNGRTGSGLGVVREDGVGRTTHTVRFGQWWRLLQRRRLPLLECRRAVAISLLPGRTVMCSLDVQVPIVAAVVADERAGVVETVLVEVPLLSQCVVADGRGCMVWWLTC